MIELISVVWGIFALLSLSMIVVLATAAVDSSNSYEARALAVVLIVALVGLMAGCYTALESIEYEEIDTYEGNLSDVEVTQGGLKVTFMDGRVVQPRTGNSGDVPEVISRGDRYVLEVGKLGKSRGLIRFERVGNGSRAKRGT